MTSEAEVYLWTKRLFRSRDWTILASDPPRGTDVPRLEVKEPGGTQSLTKNANAVINDLVYCRDGALALVECKDSAAKTGMDVEKLERLCGDPAWRASLADAMAGRSLFARDDAPAPSAVRSGDALVPVLAYPGDPQSGLPAFVQLTFEDGDATVTVGRDVPERARERFHALSG
ncbi:hypothetical protein [Halobacterium sp. CBA1126]|uniref:hypothetical protein n=1 Tax=Halobacterium sp. CBA1126 TaxID=2668074 RepID=UPI0012FC85E6|nr:hypothetical protein [Halobacterium sp. CBA1126]MUV59496.1 hypothetical protein [Halobacterium sp. CBA1126]